MNSSRASLSPRKANYHLLFQDEEIVILFLWHIQFLNGQISHCPDDSDEGHSQQHQGFFFF